MKRIFKYPIADCNRDEQPFDRIRMRSGARLISAVIQSDYLYIYAIVETDNPPTIRNVYVIGTGSIVPNHIIDNYITTIEQEEYVWHIFDGGEENE